MLVLIDVGDAGPIELPPGRRCHAKAAGLVDENEPEYVIPGTTHDSTVIESEECRLVLTTRCLDVTYFRISVI